MTANIKKILGPGVNFGSYIGVFGPGNSALYTTGDLDFTSSLTNFYKANYFVSDIDSFSLSRNSEKRATVTNVNGSYVVAVGQGQAVYFIKIDSSGNIHAPAMRSIAGSFPYYTVWNSAGTRLWSRSYANGEYDSGYPATSDLSIEGSTSVIVSQGYVGNISRTAIFSINNTNGNLNWRRIAYGSYNGSGYFNKVVQDSSGNVYAVGISSHNAPLATQSGYSNYRDMTMVKFNSSGTLQWKVMIDGVRINGGGTTLPIGLCFYDNAIFFTKDNYLVKVNASNGQVAWARLLGVSPTETTPQFTFSNGILYMLVEESGTGMFLYAIDSASGTLHFLRKLKALCRNYDGVSTPPAGITDLVENVPRDIRIDGSFINILFNGVSFDYLKTDFVLGQGWNTWRENSVMCKFPLDGSKAIGDYLVPTTSGKFAKVTYTSNHGVSFPLSSSGGNLAYIYSYTANELVVSDPVASGDSYTYWQTTGFPLTELQTYSSGESYSAYKLRI